jgi:hypothetical protein
MSSSTSGDGSVDWRELREFAAVDLEKSFVLGWEVEAGLLMIDVDLYLMPEHAGYEEPRPAEKVCIRPATLEFPLFEGIESDRGKPLADLGNGVISGLQQHNDGRYEISGDFGVVLIDAERPIIRLKVP